jgi:hypothetical protein
MKSKLAALRLAKVYGFGGRGYGPSSYMSLTPLTDLNRNTISSESATTS